MFGYYGFVLSVVIRMEASVVGFSVLFGDCQVYCVVVSCHGLVMIFGFVMPIILGGLANYMLPVLVGFVDLVLCRVNCVSL